MSSSPKAEVSKKERVNVSLSSDLLEALDSEAARRKMDRSALLTEYARTGLNGGIAPAPVVVDVPTAKQIAEEIAALAPAGTTDVTSATAMLTDHGRKLTAIYRELLTQREELLTQREMTKDRIAERYIDHGVTKAAGEAAAQEMYEMARGKAQDEMKATS